MGMRIGNGYDIHRLVSDRPLILGGINIPHEMGLLGHSDADALTHAIMDAMLGALSLGDIGHYFPPTDPQWKGADSLKLLAQVNALIQEKGWCIGNLDTVIVAERPKIKPHIAAMRDRLAAVLQISPDQIGIKATTNEKLDAIGREEGIAAYTVALLVKSSESSKKGES
ncbi:MAG: 2-C-methyl-D-erythritol 2,4-cyclodiphosphate synthase [Leptolyngbyaceae cyanobacterium CRU_2_3]|nr:2-C-methyl-D-erythritol 2,4-cyclodiphosphate synthase [Leptolyngbyaceae cyanobacterium CRU_2_3]